MAPTTAPITATATATLATTAAASTTLICLAAPEHLYGALRSDAALELIASWHPVYICCALLPSGSIVDCFTLDVVDPDDEQRHALVVPAGGVP
jgi:hypothetical protein